MNKAFCMVFGALAAVSSTSAAAQAGAQSQCSDVLRDGTLSRQTVLTNDQIRSLAYSHLMTAEFSERNNANILGATVPVGDIILGADVSQAEYRRQQSALAKVDLRTLDERRFRSVAISSGDETITGRWLDCMSRRSGLIAYLEPTDPTHAILHLRWSAPSEISDAPRKARLAEDIALPAGFRFQAGADSCTKRGNDAQPNFITTGGCDAVIVADAPSNAMTLSVNVEQGNPQSVYWAARTQLRLEKRPLSGGVRWDSSHKYVVNAQRRFIHQAVMPDEVIKEGWVFSGNSSIVSVTQEPARSAVCSGASVTEIQDHVLSIDFRVDNNHANDTLICHWSMNPEIIRWVKVDKD